MPKNNTRKRALHISPLDALLHGAMVHAKLALAWNGVAPREIARLVHASRRPDFDSGWYKSANHDASLREQQRIASMEVLKQHHCCRHAWNEKQWIDSLEAALLLGEARSHLFSVTWRYRQTKKGSDKTASKKREAWPTILEAADRIYFGTTSKNRPINYSLHADVMALPGMPQRGPSAFSEHWRKHRAANFSK